jgi:hypothetical protein
VSALPRDWDVCPSVSSSTVLFRTVASQVTPGGVGGACGAGFPQSEMCVRTRSCGFVDHLILQVSSTHSGSCISNSGRLGIYGGVVRPESLLTQCVCPPPGLGCVSERELVDRLIPHCAIMRHPRWRGWCFWCWFSRE